MKNQPQLILFQLGIFLIFVGLLFSRFTISLGMILLFLNALIFGSFKETWATFQKNRTLIALTSIFFIYFLTGIYSNDKSYFLERIRIALPFLILPFAFAKNPIAKSRQTNHWLYFFFILIVGSAIQTCFRIWFRYQTLLVLFEKNNYIPAPINHVRYSLLIAFSIFIAWHLWKKHQFHFQFEKHLVAISGTFLICFLHLLGIRSGLMGFYLACLFLLFLHLKKQYFTSSFLGILLFPIFAYCLFPNFKNKLIHTKSTIYEYVENKPINHLSDTGRIKSIKAGIEIGQQNFWFGTGLGDLKSALIKVYKKEGTDPNGEIFLPHNQFVFFFAFSGIIGCVLFCYLHLTI